MTIKAKIVKPTQEENKQEESMPASMATQSTEDQIPKQIRHHQTFTCSTTLGYWAIKATITLTWTFPHMTRLNLHLRRSGTVQSGHWAKVELRSPALRSPPRLPLISSKIFPICFSISISAKKGLQDPMRETSQAATVWTSRWDQISQMRLSHSMSEMLIVDYMWALTACGCTGIQTLWRIPSRSPSLRRPRSLTIDCPLQNRRWAGAMLLGSGS